MKKSSVVTFNSGEYVVYPTHGVGKVTNIAKQTIAGSELELLVVNFDKDKMTLRVPMAKLDQVGLRKISDETTMKEALATLKGKPRIKKVMWSRRAQEYENKINSGNPVAVAEVIRDLHRSEKSGRPVLTANCQIYEHALERLASEVAVYDNISLEEANKKLLETVASRNL